MYPRYVALCVILYNVFRVTQRGTPVATYLYTFIHTYTLASFTADVTVRNTAMHVFHR